MPLRSCTLFAILQEHPSFFSPENDRMGGPRVPVPPFNHLRSCASAGCDLCSIMTSAAGEDTMVPHLREVDLETRVLHLSRATISFHQDITLYMGMDDLLPPKTFVRIPSPWKERLTLAQFGNPPDPVGAILTWVQNCIDNHPKCCLPQPGFVPTRLLEVNHFVDSDDLRLVELRSQAKLIPYLSLSHCWGPSSKHPIKTTTANLQDRQKRILFSSLSRTFQDAVIIVKALSQQYLWIDSLCIIQDDQADWIHEASLMADIYRQSLCTLCALSSEDSDQGCRVNGRGEQFVQPRYIDMDLGENRIRLFETVDDIDDRKMDWHDEYGDDRFKHKPYGSNPLRTRAWAFQERELSVRCVHFSRKTMLWECLTMKGSTEIPHTVLRVYDDVEPLPVSDARGASERDRWFELMEDYSSRFMSFETDKLPAIAGLAKYYQQTYLPTSNFFAGMWKEHLPRALLWKSRRVFRFAGDRDSVLAAFQPRRPMKYRAPSWSWASLDGDISYASQRIERISEPSRPRLQVSAYQCAVTGCSLNTSVSGLVETAQNAAITVFGYIVPTTFNYRSPETEGRVEGMRPLYAPDGDVVGAIFPDIVTELQYVEEIFCLSVCAEVEESQEELPHELFGEMFDQVGEMVMGLALSPQGQVSHLFRRVGLVRWLKKSIYDRTNASEITII